MKEGRGHRADLRPGHWARVMGSSRHGLQDPDNLGTPQQHCPNGGIVHRTSCGKVYPREHEWLGRVRGIMIKRKRLDVKKI